MRSHRSGADGVVGIAVMFRNAFFRRGSTLDHPVRSVKGGFATSFWCRVHPSSIRRGIASLTFIHTFHDPLMTAPTGASSCARGARSFFHAQSPLMNKQPSPLQLLRIWTMIGMQSFGGGSATLYLIRRVAVERHG